MREKWTWIAATCIVLCLGAVFTAVQLDNLHKRVAHLEALLPYITPIESK